MSDKARKAERQVVDSALLARVAGLGLTAAQLAEGTMTGLHKSPRHGASVEFAQHREYVPGDELKHLDWKAVAKSDKYYVKQYEDETNLRTFLLVDTSASMNYARKGLPTKLEYASQMATALAYTLLRQGDAVGLLTFANGLGHYVPPRARPDHFWQLARTLERAEIEKGTDLVRPLEHIAEVGGRRGLVLIFSDAMDFRDQVAALSRQLRRRHQVAFFHVLDPDELEFPFDELTLFEGLEEDERLLADPRAMKEQYLIEMRDFCANLKRDLAEGDVRYTRVRTDEPPERTLLSFLAGPGRRSGASHP
ncbi:MAG: DUF58 domain-containing protein [Bradymonadia bacterium]